MSIGAWLFGPVAIYPVGLFSPGGPLFEPIGKSVLHPLGVTNASAATYTGKAIFVFCFVGLVYLTAYAIKRNNTKLSIAVCVLSVTAYLVFCAIISTHLA